MNEIIAIQQVRRRKKRVSPVIRDRRNSVRKSQYPRRQVRKYLVFNKNVSIGLVCVLCSIPLFILVAAMLVGAEFTSLSISLNEDHLRRASMAQYTGIGMPLTGIQQLDDSIPLDLSETFSWQEYTVRRGDTVSDIAQAHGLSMDAIIALNGITNVKRLQEGMTLKIPNMDGVPYTVRRGDSLSRISVNSGIPLESILDANDLQSETISVGSVLFLPGARMQSDELKKALGELFIYPVRGRLSSGYGWRNDPFTGERRFHAAIDLAADTGTPIAAAMDGRISTAGVNAVYGRYVIISHNNGYQTLYAHMSNIAVNKDQRVLQGARIGSVGSTGYSTGPHLHFAIYRNGRALNPFDFLEK